MKMAKVLSSFPRNPLFPILYTVYTVQLRVHGVHTDNADHSVLHFVINKTKLSNLCTIVWSTVHCTV